MVAILTLIYQFFLLWKFFEIINGLWKSYHIENKEILELKYGFMM
jgi:hypothetical protein